MVEKEAGKDTRLFIKLLIEKGIIKDEQLGKLVAEFKEYRFINLRNS